MSKDWLAWTWHECEKGHGHNHNNHHEFFEEKSNLMAAVTPTSLVSNGASVDIKQDLSDHTVEEDGSV